MAGLAAGCELAAAGLKVHILEARDRVGGRILTVRDPRASLPIELGAEFVHGRPPEIWEIIRSPGLEASEVAGANWRFHGGRLEKLSGGLEDVFEQMRDAPDESFADFIAHCDCSDDAKRQAIRFVEGFNAARKERISVRALAFESAAADAIEGDRSFRLISGYDREPEALLARFAGKGGELELDTIARRVRWRSGHVEVACDGAEFAGVRAIVAVPLGVLQSGGLRFTPEPGNVLRAARRLAMGNAIRITFDFRERFWEHSAEDMSFLYFDEGPFPTWWTALPAPVPRLTAWAAGPHADRLSGADEESLVAQALAMLERLPGARDVRGLVERWYVHDWRSDPFSRGAYSYVPVGALDAREALAAAVDETLWFAGEAANVEGHAATVHGAIASGRRAARQILGTIR